MDDPSRIADAIGNCFDALLTTGLRYGMPDEDIWQQRHADLDQRVQVGTAWSVIDDPPYRVSVFGT